MPKKNNSPFANAFRFGLGAGLGAGISTMLFIFLGLVFFIPGVILLSRERKKKKDERSGALLISAYVLMALGCIVGLGMGASFLFSNVMEEF